MLPLLGVGHRSTMDIDLAGISEQGQSETLKLMELAEELGLPIEAINQAAAYFLLRETDFRKHLVLLHQGTRATFFRPDATLFVRLKVSRLSESDLEDCLQMLKFAARHGEKPDRTALSKRITQEMGKETAKAAASDAGSDRRARLERLLSEFAKR